MADFSGGYEAPTHTVDDVAVAVKRQFGDESGVQVTNDDIVRWTNQAQAEINQRNKVLKTKATVPSVSGHSDYSMPVDTLQVESLTYQGKVIPNMDFKTAQDYISRQDPAHIIVLPFPRFWYVWGGVVSLWPAPRTTDPIQVFYTRKPQQVADRKDSLDLPDKYYEVIVAYVMQQAYEMDEDWNAVSAKSAQVEQRISLYAGEEQDGQTLTYPSIGLIDGELF